MKYEVRIQNPGSRDIVVTDVEADGIRDVVESWCGRYTTIVVTQQKEGGAE